jgi:hypothetical protein
VRRVTSTEARATLAAAYAIAVRRLRLGAEVCALSASDAAPRLPFWRLIVGSLACVLAAGLLDALVRAVRPS